MESRGLPDYKLGQNKFDPVVWASDWRGKGSADYSTNPAVLMAYTGLSSIGMREAESRQFVRDILTKDVVVGADYYALMQSRPYFTDDFLMKHGQKLAEGGVVYITIRGELRD